MFDYLLDYLSYRLSFLVLKNKTYASWREKYYSLKSTEIKNTKLAKELEEACHKNNGFLTFSEYTRIEQFGINGYHSHGKLHGITDVHKNWPKTIARLCQQKNIKHIIEFGPGEAELATESIKQAKKLGYDLFWSGIEINVAMHEKIKKRFYKEGLVKNLTTIGATPDSISWKEKSLVLFAYCLDSIPPHIFLNTTDKKDFPNAQIGITVKNNMLQEIILTPRMLAKKNLRLENGIFTDASTMSYDLSSWMLFPGQRAYITIDAFTILAKAVKHAAKESFFVITEEARQQVSPWTTNHLCLPKNLLTYKREVDNLEKAYQHAGKSLWYYPQYFHTILTFLHGLGLKEITYGIEQQLAKELRKEQWIGLKKMYYTTAFLTTKKTNTIKQPLVLLLPRTKLV